MTPSHEVADITQGPTSAPQTTFLVGNPAALTEVFPERSTELMECLNVKLCGELPEDDPAGELWHRLDAHRPERIWIVGGDGTVNLVGQCALRTNDLPPCWLTPAGTANDLVRSMLERYPRDQFQATSDCAVSSPELKVDLLSVRLDGNPWAKCSANMFTLGTSARNTHYVTSEIKSRWGALAYVTQFWRAMGDLEPFSIRLSVGQGEERVVDDILNLFVANGKFCGGGFKIAPKAIIDDGKMDVLVIRQGTTTQLAHLATTYLTGNHAEHELVEHFTAERLTILCEEPSPLTLDGESFTAERIEIDVRPSQLSLTLLLPS